MTEPHQPMPESEAARSRAARNSRASLTVLGIAIVAGILALIACWESTVWGAVIAVFGGMCTGVLILPGSLPLLFRLDKKPLGWMDTILALAAFGAVMWWSIGHWPTHVVYRALMCVGLAMAWVVATAFAATDAFTELARRLVRSPLETLIALIAVAATLGAAGWVVASRWVDGGAWWENPLSVGLGLAAVGAVGGQTSFFVRSENERISPQRRLVGIVVAFGAALWVGQWLWEEGWLQRVWALFAGWLAYLVVVVVFVPQRDARSERQESAP